METTSKSLQVRRKLTVSEQMALKHKYTHSVYFQTHTVINGISSKNHHILDCKLWSYDHRQFHALFGVSVETTILLWIVLDGLRGFSFTLKPEYLLWTLHFLNVYPTCDVATQYWHVDPKPYRTWICRIILLLYFTLDLISFNNRFDELYGPMSVNMVIDATELTT